MLAASLVKVSLMVGRAVFILLIWLASASICCALELTCSIWLCVCSICSCSSRIAANDCVWVNAACCFCKVASASRALAIKALVASCCCWHWSRLVWYWIDCWWWAIFSFAKAALSCSSAFKRLPWLSKFAASVSISCKAAASIKYFSIVANWALSWLNWTVWFSISWRKPCVLVARRCFLCCWSSNTCICWAIAPSSLRAWAIFGNVICSSS